MNKCVICGKPITFRAIICKGCQLKYDLYGKSYREYPKWLKELRNLERRQKRHDELFAQNVMLIDPLILEEMVQDGRANLVGDD